jgi:hypothetical protein
MQATNFLRAFSQLPEASRLELLDQTMATAFVPREGSDKVLILLTLLVQRGVAPRDARPDDGVCAAGG